MVDKSGGMPGFEIVGLPDAAVKEARERVRAAIKNNGFRFPPSRLTVNLAPADRKKAGTLYDLPILVGILAAQGELPRVEEDSAFLGELALDGTLRRISGALPMAIAAERCGVKKLFLPAENASEAAFAESVEVYGIESVGELVRHLRGEKALTYIRGRKDVDEQSNVQRMERQNQYLQALKAQVKSYVNTHSTFSSDVVLKLADHMVTDYSIDLLDDALETLLTYDITKIHKIEGELKEGKEHMEFYADETAKKQLVVDLFYRLKE